MSAGKLWVGKSRDPNRWVTREWIVVDKTTPIRVIARFASHRAALNYALWKSALLPNYGGC